MHAGPALFADELDSVSDRKTSEKKSIEQVFEAAFPNVRVPEQENRRGNDEFSWTKENVAIALDYLERTGYHEALGSGSKVGYYLVHEGKLYRMKVGTRFSKGRYINECDSSYVIWRLTELKESGRLDQVDFKYGK